MDCGFDLTRGLLGDRAAARLRADPIKFDHRSGPEAIQNRRAIVLTGFGDAQSATPLAMTTVYASLASGKLVRPSILALPRNPDGCPKDPVQDECAAAFPNSPGFASFLSLMHAGLHAVVASQGGTAFGRFDRIPQLIERVFAKTGTATYRGRINPWDRESKAQELNALWLVAWIEGDKSPGPLGHRLAFGCHVSGGAPRQLGADFCAPAIRDILIELSRSTPQ
jgi:cell division protein FtsI/penicillin-binding protein 2